MTTVCPHCQVNLDLLRLGRELSCCPSCAGNLGEESAASWVDVAKVTNLAEAGFLASDLAGLGLDARVFATESFSAVTGAWVAAYLIQVPQTDSTAAVARIRQHVVEEDAASVPLLGCEDGPVDPVVWRPVALLVIAGIASFLLGQRFADQGPARAEAPPRSGLPAAVDSIGRPFYTEPLPGKPRHRLQYRSRHQTWYLETDMDGDGRFENQTLIPER